MENLFKCTCVCVGVFARYMGLILCIELPACLSVVVAARLANIFIQFLISFTFFFCPSHSAHCQHIAHSMNVCVCVSCFVLLLQLLMMPLLGLAFSSLAAALPCPSRELNFGPCPSAAATLLQCADLLIRCSTRRCRHTVVVEKLSLGRRTSKQLQQLKYS